jgi:hypothetical protein
MVGRESGFVTGYRDFHVNRHVSAHWHEARVLFHVAGLGFTWLNLKLATTLILLNNLKNISAFSSFVFWVIKLSKFTFFSISNVEQTNDFFCDLLCFVLIKLIFKIVAIIVK